MNTFCQCIVSIGLFIIIGAAGSTDLNTISLTETMLYILIGIVVMFIGLHGCHVNKNKKGGKRYD